MILFDLFQEIKKDASLLLNPTLRDLELFIYGVINYWEMHDLPTTGDHILFKKFQKWVPEHFKINPQLGWVRLIRLHARHDVHALDLFFELWAHFQSENPAPEKRDASLPKHSGKIIDIPDLFIDIKRRPGQYLGDSTFQNLINYLNGIAYCRAYLNWPVPQAEDRFIRFTQWVPLWFRVSEDHSWHRICALYQSGCVHGLEEFFKLWDRFDDLIEKLEKARSNPKNKRIVKQAAWACANSKYSEGFELFANLLARKLSPVERCHILLKRSQLSELLGNDDQATKDMREAAAIYREKADQSKPWWELKIMIDFD